jgi:hypothetical protein
MTPEMRPLVRVAAPSTIGGWLIAAGYLLPVSALTANLIVAWSAAGNALGRFGGAAVLVFTMLPALAFGGLLVVTGTIMVAVPVCRQPSAASRKEWVLLICGGLGTLAGIGVGLVTLLQAIRVL